MKEQVEENVEEDEVEFLYAPHFVSLLFLIIAAFGS